MTDVSNCSVHENEQYHSSVIDDPVYRARVIAVCQKQPAIMLSGLVAIGFTVFLAMGKGADQVLYAWAAITLLLMGVRHAYTVYCSGLSRSEIAPYHAYMFVAIMAVWGSLWCVATLLFFPLLTTLMQAAYFAMFIAMIAVSSSSHAVYLPAFYAFLLPFFLAMGYVVTTHFPSPYHINGIVYCFVLVSLASSTHKGAKVMIESFRLRFENLDLITELKAQKEQAEKANLSKSTFLAAASHDLRQPLHALTLFTCALEETGTAPRRLMQQIKHSVDALQGLFNALLDISQLDAGTLVVEKVHFNSRDLIDQLANDFDPIAKEKQISMIWDKRPIVLYSDPKLLEQILRNLLSNALRYTPAGQVELSLTVEEQHVAINIIDSGIGIDANQQEQIFEEFMQLGNPERDRNKGLGLGLAIVKRVTTLLNHEIKLRSTPAKGSTFTLVVDIGDLERVKGNPISTPLVEQEGSGTVLVIDDEAAIREGMAVLLGKWGFDVVTAADLESALKKLLDSDTVPDFIIADYRLKENLTGVDAIESLRMEFNEDIPAIIMSGDIGEQRLREVRDAGLSMLHKPVPPIKLRQFLTPAN